MKKIILQTKFNLNKKKNKKKINHRSSQHKVKAKKERRKIKSQFYLVKANKVKFVYK